MNFIHRCRTASVITGFLVCGLALAVSLGPLAGVASAATSPAITGPSGTLDTSLPVDGSGFTPGGQVSLEVDSGTAVISSTNVVASEPDSIEVCPHGVCHEVTISGGQFQTTVALSKLGCAVIAHGTVTATDLSTGRVASKAIVWQGAC